MEDDDLFSLGFATLNGNSIRIKLSYKILIFSDEMGRRIISCRLSLAVLNRGLHAAST